MNPLIRRYKVHKIVPCLNDEELEIISFIESKLIGLYPLERVQSIDYMISPNISLIRRNLINNSVVIKYYEFWEVLLREHFTDEDLRYIVKYFIFIHLGFKVDKIILRP